MSMNADVVANYGNSSLYLKFVLKQNRMQLKEINEE